MRVVSPTFQIISIGGSTSSLMNKLELIARVCYKSEDKITNDGESAKKLIKKLIDNHHEAMLEHHSISIMFTVDRGISHELVRHRLASFAQESTRYCNYSDEKFGKEITVIQPNFLIRDSQPYNIWYAAMLACEMAYFKMLECGCSPQQARDVLPTSLKTDIVVTANLREWRHICSLRTAMTAHPQMREVVVPLLYRFKTILPIIFDDVGDDLMIGIK